MNKKLVFFTKAHVDTYTRSDGAVVQAHETKVHAAAPAPGDVGHHEHETYGVYFRRGDMARDARGTTHTVLSHSGAEVHTDSGRTFHPTKLKKIDLARAAKKHPDIGGGLWSIGHKVKMNLPHHALHGHEGEITGRGKEHGFVRVRGRDEVTHTVKNIYLLPAAGHSWPDVYTREQKVYAKTAAASKSTPKTAEAPYSVTHNVRSSAEMEGPVHKVDAKPAEVEKRLNMHKGAMDLADGRYSSNHIVTGKDGKRHVVYANGDSVSVRSYGHSDAASTEDLKAHIDGKAADPKPKKKRTVVKVKPALDPHPSVIGKATNVTDHSLDFNGKTYHKTFKDGNSLHDQTKVSEYEHPESGHRVWKDDTDRVHADNALEAKQMRGEK